MVNVMIAPMVIVIVTATVTVTQVLHPTVFDNKSFDKNFRGYPRPSETSLDLLSLSPILPRPQKPSRNLVETSKKVTQTLKQQWSSVICTVSMECVECNSNG